jgi:hypothetical protein
MEHKNGNAVVEQTIINPLDRFTGEESDKCWLYYVFDDWVLFF